jgi:4-hydroxy-3-methylbut-2-enyl diphosphate reductase
MRVNFAPEARLTQKNPISILLAAPRGFCAGVDRAIQIVEQAIRKWGAPVYVRHEIVHNRHVVERLEGWARCSSRSWTNARRIARCLLRPRRAEVGAGRSAGARDDLSSTPPARSFPRCTSRPSAISRGPRDRPDRPCRPPGGDRHHGPAAARASITLLETVEDAEAFAARSVEAFAFVTQTTLSVDDTAEMVACCSGAFPEIAAPHKEDICYATTNRQDAVKAMAEQADLVLVIGSPKSSNSVRLSEVAKRAGARDAQLVASADDVDWAWFDGARTLA